MQRYDGGMAQGPGLESQGGSTFCGLASLVLINGGNIPFSSFTAEVIFSLPLSATCRCQLIDAVVVSLPVIDATRRCRKAVQASTDSPKMNVDCADSQKKR